MTENKEELKILLMKVKEESEKVGLKLNIQKTKIMASGPITSWQMDGETMETVTDFIFLGSKITADGDCRHEIKRYLFLGRKTDKHKQHIKKQRHYFSNKGPCSQSYSFSSSYVWTWELDHQESWVPKNWCFWTVVLEKTLESPLDSKEIKAVKSKGDQSWIFIRRTDAEVEAPVLWPSDMKNWLTGKDSDAGKDWRQEEKGMTENEMVGWHHWLDGHEFEQGPGIGDGQGSLHAAVHGVAKSWTRLSYRTGQLSSRVFLNLSLCDVSLWLASRPFIFGKSTTEVVCVLLRASYQEAHGLSLSWYLRC